MTTPAARTGRGALVLLWAGASAVAGLATLICYGARPGINWGLWTLVTCLGCVWAIDRSGRRPTLAEWGPMALAVALAFGTAVTTDVAFTALIFLTVVALLSVAMLIAGGVPVAQLGPIELATAPLRAALRAIVESWLRVAEAAGILGSERARPIVRGLMIALPVMALFALLLSAADPLFATVRDDVAALIAPGEWTARLICFLVVGTIALGAFGTGLHAAPVSSTSSASPTSAGRVGDTERLVVLGGVGSLFAIFLLLQLGYFFGNVAGVVGSGVTYAEYVHRGFVELTVVATLCTLLIVGLDAVAVRGSRAGLVSVVSVMLTIEVQLLLDSAYRRLTLYESAYGYTTLRLYARVYVIVVSLLLLLLAFEIWRAIDARRLCRRAAMAGAGALLVLTYWNHAGWVARRNIERFEVTGKIDLSYLLQSLSPDALPTIFDLMPQLTASSVADADVRQCLANVYQFDMRRLSREHWYEANARASAARHVLGALHLPPPDPARWQSCHPTSSS